MKKLLSVLLIALLSVVIIGCGGGETKPKNEPKPAGGGTGGEKK